MCYAKKFKFYIRAYMESLNDSKQDSNMIKMFVLKDLPGNM